MALVGDEQPAGAAWAEVGVAAELTTATTMSWLAEVVPATVTEATDLRAGRHAVARARRSTGRLQLAGGHEHERPARGPPQFGDGGGHADDRLAGAGDRLDHAATVPAGAQAASASRCHWYRDCCLLDRRAAARCCRRVGGCRSGVGDGEPPAAGSPPSRVEAAVGGMTVRRTRTSSAS